ncbi:5'-AMP-activated protein kinase subunit gamma-2 [Porphyridium purpureum]|uniref:5'-AMP-activated protein kinase subunit gamma-2 n=1 Tax=Porphyridium purpureum TaxID=35688 RepID=A0A5J4Z4Q0_PORPP|nr:5'-AMP-activated protein kinase subunit gamma-2 [Porphyridium purpureum]|eukprot:POR9540..scf295_1
MDMEVEGVEPMELEDSEAVARIRSHVADFMKSCLTEDLVPESSKVVVLDCNLSLRTAFQTLQENAATAVPVWDPQRLTYVGVLSRADFIELATHYLYKSSSTTDMRMLLTHALEHQKVKAWLHLKAMWEKSGGRPAPGDVTPIGAGEGALASPEMMNRIELTPTFVAAEDSLYVACCLLQERRIQSVPIYSQREQMILYLLSHLSVLRFVHQHVAKHVRLGSSTSLAAGGSAGTIASMQGVGGESSSDGRELFDLTVAQLRIGTFHDLATVTYSEPIRRAFDLMMSRGINAVPVIDEHGMVLDEYSRSDACSLVQEIALINLEMCISDAIRTFRQVPVQVCTCRRSETLRQIFERFEAAQSYRLYFVSNTGSLEGVLSLSDLLGYFLSE